MFTSESTSDTEREITSFLNCAPVEYVEYEKPAECPPLSLALPSGTDFTMSPLEAANKIYYGKIMPSTACLTACDGQLEEGGYSHWLVGTCRADAGGVDHASPRCVSSALGMEDPKDVLGLSLSAPQRIKGARSLIFSRVLSLSWVLLLKL